jgi:hypothetical protein
VVTRQIAQTKPASALDVRDKVRHGVMPILTNVAIYRLTNKEVRNRRKHNRPPQELTAQVVSRPLLYLS